MTENGFSERLERYQELERRREELEARLNRAEEEKSSVKEDIYARVRKEYQGALEVVNQDLEPLRSEIDESHRDWSGQLEELTSKKQGMSEKLEEIEFRRRVGEYDQHTFAELHTPLNREFESLSDQCTELGDKLDLIKAVRDGASTGPLDETRRGSDERGFEPLEDKAEADTRPDEEQAETPVSEQEETIAPGSPELGDELVDPTTWTSELSGAGDRRQSDRRSPDTPETPHASPAAEQLLSAMADPSVQPPQHAQPADDAHDVPIGTKEPVAGFPILVIVKGPGSGKKLPLMPMTMTLGREHDNNIELKDEDVARYHARISFERGQYVLEDLASTSGTFVNDEKITQAALRHGDKLRVGATEMIVDFE